MTIRFDCQFCGKTLKADDSKAGKKVKCPSCEGVLTIPELALTPETAAAELEDFEDDSGVGGKAPASKSGQRTIPCPMCDEPVSPGETTCPWCSEEISVKPRRRQRRPIANPGKRLMGFLMDLIASVVFIAPGIVLGLIGAVNSEQNGEPPALVIVGILLGALGGLVLFVIQLYLLINRSQSIGKYFVKLQIMDYETDVPAGFVKTFLLRSVVNQLIGNFTCALLYFVIDSLFVFNDERRCLHDQIAGTYVVDISES